MTGYIGSFERKSASDRSPTRSNVEYNPTKVEYYSSADELVRVEEDWRGTTNTQTISGSSYAQNWPSYTYTVTYNEWGETTTWSGNPTVSGVNHAFIGTY